MAGSRQRIVREKVEPWSAMMLYRPAGVLITHFREIQSLLILQHLQCGKMGVSDIHLVVFKNLTTTGSSGDYV